MPRTQDGNKKLIYLLYLLHCQLLRDKVNELQVSLFIGLIQGENINILAKELAQAEVADKAE